MKILTLMACLPTLMSGVYFAIAADSPTTNQETDLPAAIGIYTISQDVREEANKFTTSELRVAYLSSVIASNSVDTNKMENFRKSSAIMLISVIKSTNSIPLLVSNITFVDAKIPGRPAFEALEAIGESAVPYLLDVVKDPSAPTNKLECVIKELRIIKRASIYPDQWDKFVDEQKGKLPPELRGRIDRQIWVDD